MKRDSIKFLPDIAPVIAITIALAIANSPAWSADSNKQNKDDSNQQKKVGSKKRTDDTSKSHDEDDIRKILMELEGAFAAKAADKAAALFSDDVSFIDQTGYRLRGSQVLQDRFATLLQQETVPSITIHPEEFKLPASNVALVTGVVGRKQSGADFPSTRFSMVLVKSNLGWKITEFTETLLQETRVEFHLQQLGWMIGNWHVANVDANTHLDVEWAPGRKFIFSKCVVNKNPKTSQTDTQVIGWDPRSNSIVSWHFDSNGGFGTGVWTNNGGRNEWSVDVQGTGADGSTTRATNVFSLKKTDEFTWQSVNRSLDNSPVGDTDPLTVQRDLH